MRKIGIILGLLFFAASPIEAKDLMLVCGKKDGVAKVWCIDLDASLIQGESVIQEEIILKDENGNIITSEPLSIASGLGDSNFFKVSFDDYKIRMYNRYGNLVKIDDNSWYWETDALPDGLDDSGKIYCSSETNKYYSLDNYGNVASITTPQIREIRRSNYDFNDWVEWVGLNPVGMSGGWLASRNLLKAATGTWFQGKVPEPFQRDIDFSPTDIYVDDRNYSEDYDSDLFFYFTASDGNIYKIKYINLAVSCVSSDYEDFNKWVFYTDVPGLRIRKYWGQITGLENWQHECGHIYNSLYGFSKDITKCKLVTFLPIANFLPEYRGTTLQAKLATGPVYGIGGEKSVTPEKMAELVNGAIVNTFTLPTDANFFDWYEIDVTEWYNKVMNGEPNYGCFLLSYPGEVKKAYFETRKLPAYLTLDNKKPLGNLVGQFVAPIPKPEGLSIGIDFNTVKEIYSQPSPFHPSLSDTKNSIIRYKTITEPRKVTLQIRDPFELKRWGIDPTLVRTLTNVELNLVNDEGFWEEYESKWDGREDLRDTAGRPIVDEQGNVLPGNLVPAGIYSISILVQDTDDPGKEYNSGSSQASVYAYTPSINEGTIHVDTNTVTFKYKVWGRVPYKFNGGLPEKAKVCLNIYNSNFDLIKRVIQEKADMWEIVSGKRNIKINSIDWDYSAYNPGTYYYTIWAEDDRGEQAHIVGKRFTVPGHEIKGQPEVYPTIESSWESEGPVVRVAFPLLNILIDSDNDGVLSEEYDDPIEENGQGFVFWTNEDNDHWEVDSRYWSEDSSTARGRKGEPDNTNNTINGIHDLEDFFTMRLQIPGQVAGEKFYLEGAPVRVFKRYFENPEYIDKLTTTEKDKQHDYLTNLSIAEKQHLIDVLGNLNVNSPLEIKREDFTEDGMLWLIFEGTETGGPYDLKFYKEVNGVKVEEDIVRITIKQVKDMYKFWNIRTNKVENSKGFNIYDPDTLITPSGAYYSQVPDKMFVYLHGYNVDVNGARQWFDTMYKRLYRAGYRGGFSGITWEGDEGTALDFNMNWVNAFRSAELAKRIIIRIQNEWGKGPVIIGAHSLGNMVVLTSVRKLAYEGKLNIVDKVIHLEAAAPADVYREVTGGELDYFDGSFWENFEVCPRAVNSWSVSDDILPHFAYWIKELGWTTPDYKTDNVFGPPVSFTEKSSQGAMGNIPAAYHFPSGKEFYDWRVSPDKDGHPYSIRDHSSMLNEYYADVTEFFETLLKKIMYSE